MNRALALPLLLAASVVAAHGPVTAPGPIQLTPPSSVLDPHCVDRVKGHGADAARQVHECRKAQSPPEHSKQQAAETTKHQAER